MTNGLFFAAECQNVARFGPNPPGAGKASRPIYTFNEWAFAPSGHRARCPFASGQIPPPGSPNVAWQALPIQFRHHQRRFAATRHVPSDASPRAVANRRPCAGAICDPLRRDFRRFVIQTGDFGPVALCGASAGKMVNCAWLPASRRGKPGLCRD